MSAVRAPWGLAFGVCVAARRPKRALLLVTPRPAGGRRSGRGRTAGRRHLHGSPVVLKKSKDDVVCVLGVLLIVGASL